jgi:hypothetical protein
MKTYHLDPEKFPRIRRNIILTYFFLSLVGLAIVYLYIGPPLFGSAWTLIPFVVVVFAGVGWYALRERRKYWETYELTVTLRGLKISAPKSPDINIGKEKISAVREVRQGLILSSREKENWLLIPKDLPDDDYAAVKNTLENWVGSTQ